MIIDDDIYIEHFGTKGMRWGVRNAPKNASKSEKQKIDRKRSNVKKASIILGSVAAVGAIGAGAYYAKKHFGAKVSDMPKSAESIKKFADSMAKEPVGIVHASRGRNRGFTFPQRGGLNNPLKEYDTSGLSNINSTTSFKRYGDANEKIAARFLDPIGRKDESGRIIPHDVMLPKSMSKGVNSIDDVVKVAWPHIKDVFGALYESKPDTLGPGY
jgi:uncharacterized protein (UPF0333 family)